MKPTAFLRLATLGLAAALAGCGSGPPRRINPPAISIQHLRVESAGTWTIGLRIQNFSTVPMHFDALSAAVEIDGRPAGKLDLDPDVTITANSADVVDVRFATTVKLPQGGDFAYRLKGRVHTDEPKSEYPFDYASRLSPVPGVADTWR
jgi:hypothetical protein